MSNIINSVKTWYLTKYNLRPILTVFLTVMFIGVISTVIISLVYPPYFEFTVGKMEQHLFMDYFWSVRDSMDHPYSVQHVIYPALITLVYAFIGNATLPFTDIRSDDLSIDMYNSQIPMLVYILLMIFALYLIHYIVQNKLSEKYSKNETEIIFFTILFSTPVVFAIMNGNCILYTIVFCFLFLFGYKSENKYIRYGSYICLAIAAGMKLTPAIFALLIIKDRNWKEFFVCIITILAIVLIPFVFTDGTIMDLINVALNNDTNLGGSINNIRKFFWGLGVLTGATFFETIGTIVVVIFSILTAVIVAFDRKMPQWKILTLISGCLVVGIGIGTPYLYAYFIITAVYFLITETEKTKENLIYAAFFGFVLMFINVGASTIKSLCIIAIMIVLFYEGYKHLKAAREEKLKACDRT